MLAGRGPIGSKTISYLTLTIKERCLRVIFHNSKVVALQQEMLTYEVLITPSPLQLSPLLPVTQCGPANTEHPSTPQSCLKTGHHLQSNSKLPFNLKLLVSQETRFIWVHINKLSAIVRVVRRSAQRVYSPGFLRRCCGHQALSSEHQSEMPEMSNKTIHQQSILD